MKAIVALALAGTLLSGCTGRYIDLHVTQPVRTGPPSEQVKQTLQTLYERGTTFAKDYRSASEEADLAEVPLIGAAIALGVLAVNNPSNAADTAAKIGIGTGGYVALRSLAMPSGGPDNLRRGVRAINCVLVEGADFVGTDVDGNVTGLQAVTNNLDGTIIRLEALVEVDVVPSSDAAKAETEIARLAAARANARLALARAEAASLAARSQIGAYYNAPARFEFAASEIIDALATKSAVRVPFDSAELAAKWIKAPDPTGAPPSESEGGFTMEGLIRKLNEERDALNRQIAQVQPKASAFHFVERLTAVAKCPAQV